LQGGRRAVAGRLRCGSWWMKGDGAWCE